MKNTVRIIGSLVVTLALFVVAATSQPYPDNRTISRSTSPQLGQGRVQDNSAISGSTASAQYGAPMQPFFLYSIYKPPTADVDYYVTTKAATGVGTIYHLTLVKTKCSTDAQGTILARNITCTSSGTTTGTLALVGSDIQGRRITETLTYTAGQSGLKASVKTFASLTSATLTVDTNTSRNFTVGFGNIFGLPYPFYSDLYSKALYDDDGADYPNTSMSTDVTFAVGDPTDTAADHLGTVKLGADNATGNKTPDGTRAYAVLYCVTDTLGEIGSSGNDFIYEP